MVSSILSLLVLATAVSAHPKRHHHWHHGTGTGSGGFALPTGGTYPLNGTDSANGTDFGGSALESPTSGVKTVTVSPLPLESSTSDVTVAISSISVANAVASNTVEATAESSTTSCTSSSISTITTTTVQFVTVTATAGESTGTASSSTSVADDFQVASSSSSSASLVQGTPVAAAFYGKGGSNWGGHSFAGAGAASSAQTSAQASAQASAQVSSVQSILPTTFATVAGSASVSSGASATASSAASTATSTSSSSGSSSGKKGLSFNSASLTDAFAGKGMSWAYNWAASAGGSVVSGAEYVPMLWGLDSTSAWASAAASAISSGSQHALSFNEPDLSTQSNIDPQTAATNHIKYMNPLADQVQIGSPAITNGAGTSPLMGIDWLNEFFTACAGNCKVDFVAYHWYADASAISDFKQHTQDVINAAAQQGISKVWLTEFGATGSDDDVASFLSQAVEYLDGQSAVERYAYFMCSDGILVSGDSVSSPVGEAYLS